MSIFFDNFAAFQKSDPTQNSFGLVIAKNGADIEVWHKTSETGFIKLFSIANKDNINAQKPTKFVSILKNLSFLAISDFFNQLQTDLTRFNLSIQNIHLPQGQYINPALTHDLMQIELSKRMQQSYLFYKAIPSDEAIKDALRQARSTNINIIPYCFRKSDLTKESDNPPLLIILLIRGNKGKIGKVRFLFTKKKWQAFRSDQDATEAIANKKYLSVQPTPEIIRQLFEAVETFLLNYAEGNIPNPRANFTKKAPEQTLNLQFVTPQPKDAVIMNDPILLDPAWNTGYQQFLSQKKGQAALLAQSMQRILASSEKPPKEISNSISTLGSS